MSIEKKLHDEKYLITEISAHDLIFYQNFNFFWSFSPHQNEGFFSVIQTDTSVLLIEIDNTPNK